jgi:hypothetical protein
MVATTTRPEQVLAADDLDDETACCRGPRSLDNAGEGDDQAREELVKSEVPAGHGLASERLSSGVRVFDSRNSLCPIARTVCSSSTHTARY